MDLEMTGLDPAHHVIVEIATIISDDDLTIVAEGPDLVVSATEDQLAGMDAVVQKMHEDSGLTVAIRASTISLEEAGRLTLEFLRAHVPDLGKVPLCGNSIGVDRRFLHAQLPDVEHALHYRSIDVSTVKELARRWCPSIYGRAPKKQGSHRALDDIRESIAELAYYRDVFFKIPDKPAHGTPQGTPPPVGDSPTV
jgi:oligoribonuclease